MSVFDSDAYFRVRRRAHEHERHVVVKEVASAMMAEAARRTARNNRRMQEVIEPVALLRRWCGGGYGALLRAWRRFTSLRAAHLDYVIGTHMVISKGLSECHQTSDRARFLRRVQLR